MFYGSQVAAPIFQSVMSDTLRYLGIAPSVDANDGFDEGAGVEVTVPNVTNISVAEAISTLQALGLNVRLSGSGNIVSQQQPAASSQAKAGSTVLLTAAEPDGESSGLVTVPDLRNRRFAEVANILSVLGLPLAAEGSGVAYAQDPDYGTQVEPGTTITVKFQGEDNINSDLQP